MNAEGEISHLEGVIAIHSHTIIKHTTSYLATAGRQLQDSLWAAVHQLSERFHI